MTEPTDFEMATKAFDLMTPAERERVLEHFAKLGYQSVAERFFEAVYRVVTRHDEDRRSTR